MRSFFLFFTTNVSQRVTVDYLLCPKDTPTKCITDWKVLFITIWEKHAHHLRMILKNLIEVCEYMAQVQVTSTSIDELMDRRERRLEDQRKTEQAQAQSRLNSVLAWLEINEEQDDDLDRLFGLQHGDSCAWLLATNTIRRWRGGGSENPVVWLTGKPGAGRCPTVTPAKA